MSFAIAGSALVSYGVAKMGANASQRAADTQAGAADRASQLQNDQFQRTREDNAPLLGARNDALSQIQNLLKNPQGITNDPGYQFGMDQGARALNSGAASRGMTYSGAAGKALSRFGQDYAGTKLDASYNRLSNLAGLGQVGANNNMQAGMNYANNVGNNMMGAANVNAAAGISNGNRWGNALNQVSAYGDRNGWFGGNSLQAGGGYGSVSGGYVAPDGGMFNNPSAYIPGG
jgi:hypothetical protein